MLRQRKTKPISGTYQLLPEDCGSTLFCTNAVTITLPNIEYAPNFELLIICGLDGGANIMGMFQIGPLEHIHLMCYGRADRDWAISKSSSLKLGETSITAYRGDNGKIAYDHSQSPHAHPNAQKNSDITKGEIEAKLTGVITSHTHPGGGSGSITKEDIEAVLTGIITSHTHPGGGFASTTYHEPLVNGDPLNPEIMFDGDGDIIMVETDPTMLIDSPYDNENTP